MLRLWRAHCTPFADCGDWKAKVCKESGRTKYKSKLLGRSLWTAPSEADIEKSQRMVARASKKKKKKEKKEKKKTKKKTKKKKRSKPGWQRALIHSRIPYFCLPCRARLNGCARLARRARAYPVA